MSKELNDFLVAMTQFVTKLTSLVDSIEKEDKPVTADRFQLVEKCPKCGRALIRKFNNMSRTFFIGCSGYKDSGCAFTAEWDSSRWHMMDKTRQNDLPDAFTKPTVERRSSLVQFVKEPANSQVPEPPGFNRFASWNVTSDNSRTEKSVNAVPVPESDGPF